MILSTYNLEPSASQAQVSFYGKAKIQEYLGTDEQLLISYNTNMVLLDTFSKEFHKLSDFYSLTTMKHINAFLNTSFTKKQWQSIPLNKACRLANNKQGFEILD